MLKIISTFCTTSGHSEARGLDTLGSGSGKAPIIHPQGTPLSCKRVCPMLFSLNGKSFTQDLNDAPLLQGLLCLGYTNGNRT